MKASVLEGLKTALTEIRIFFKSYLGFKFITPIDVLQLPIGHMPWLEKLYEIEVKLL